MILNLVILTFLHKICFSKTIILILHKLQDMKSVILLLIVFSSQWISAQTAEEITPPFNIKTVAFTQGGNSVLPFFKLGESFELQFDDLFGNEADYYYTITQFNYDWTPTNLAKVEYLNGMDNQRIITYQNSYNTLQQYSHYRQVFPNNFNRITKSGNYLIRIYNDNREVVFSRRFIIYEDQLNVRIDIRRARDMEFINEKHNVEMSINYGDRILQDPIRNVNVSLFQNGNWNSEIRNIKPQYTIGTELIYRYEKETQFWAGNEYYTLDNSNIRMVNNSVAKVTSGDNIYNSFLYVSYPRKKNIYTYFPDFNGNFIVKNVNTENPDIEADYSWVYFTLDAPPFFKDESIYIVGMFNNYKMTEENKMTYNPKTKMYEKAIFIKQGFTNYHYVLTDKNGKVMHRDAIDGNFFQTENNYTAIVYYRGNNDRYDRVIGVSSTNSEVIKN